jgi:hypothetical protein
MLWKPPFPPDEAKKMTADLILKPVKNEVSTFWNSILSGSPVTMVWRVLRLQMEETASRYGG